MSSPPRLRAQTKPSVSGQDGVVRQAELQRKRAQYEDNERRSFLRDGADARQKKLEASLFMQPRRADTGRSRPASAASLRRSSGDYAKARSRGDVERDRMHRRPQSAGGLGVAQISARPLHEQRDGWNANPRFETRSAMMVARRKAKLPDSTFDVDGDGNVSQEDFRLASRFDVNKDGLIDDDEQVELRKKMVASTVNRFRELQAAGQIGWNPEIEKLTHAFTDDIDATVRSTQFRNMFNKLQVKTSITNTSNSMNLRKILQQPSRGKKQTDIMMADDDGDGIVSQEELQAWQKKQREVAVAENEKRAALERSQSATHNADITEKRFNSWAGLPVNPAMQDAARYMQQTQTSMRRASVSSVASAESDLDTHRPVPRTSSGFNTRSKLFAHRKDQRVAQARERTDYHLWGSDYAFPADPVEGRNVEKALQNAGRGDRGWSDVHAPENHPRFQATWSVPTEVWTGLSMSGTWKPSGHHADITGKMPLDFRNIHPSEKPRGSSRRRGRERTTGCGTHVTLHGPLEDIPTNYLGGAGVPEALFSDKGYKGFGLNDSKSSVILKKMASQGKMV